MEQLKILFIVFCIYSIVYCIYAVKVVLVHREIQLNRLKTIKKEHLHINELYLKLVTRCEEVPLERLTLKKTLQEIDRLKRKLNNA